MTPGSLSGIFRDNTQYTMPNNNVVVMLLCCHAMSCLLCHIMLVTTGSLSGIFRDSFGNVLDLLDELFERASYNDEPEDMNFIKVGQSVIAFIHSFTDIHFHSLSHLHAFPHLLTHSPIRHFHPLNYLLTHHFYSSLALIAFNYSLSYSFPLTHSLPTETPPPPPFTPSPHPLNSPITPLGSPIIPTETHCSSGGKGRGAPLLPSLLQPPRRLRKSCQRTDWLGGVGRVQGAGEHLAK